ncbi:carbohydrate ABC transporter permease [Phytoactinopolyspora halotolerans]|uniref:Carbohydrate ABC transporter permease n=1 Tax=Phytoactinopolyspora halotolerans TaxID=1981512 RepID=A0A6L9SGT4_9ACTN|nr:carbohydrate ABC transporter permease [Phytoactinopolyspora halotolerans]NEE04595.1 carbohydrate ABC transporter permease [Phytoactinopolyspora halotolerans]
MRSAESVAAAGKRPRWAHVLIYGFLGAVALLALTPTVWVMLSSFKTGNQIFSGEGFWPSPFTVQGFVDAFTQIHLHEYLLNTLIYATLGTLGALVAAFLAAYPLARFVFVGRNALVALFSLALALPLVGLATPVFFVVRELGLFDSRLGMVIFYSALQFPFTFIVLRAFLVSTPPELEEAAMMDGAGYFTTLLRVVLPLARPALATVAVVAFVNIWNEFFFANLLLVSQENQNVQLALAGFKSQFGFNVTGAVAGATVVMLVPICLFLILQRQVISGLTAGAVK